MSKKSQFSLIEVAFLLLIISVGFSLFNNNLKIPENSNSFYVESLIDTIVYNESYRTMFILENVSNSSIEQDFTNLSLLLNRTLFNYEFSIKVNNTVKKIYSCDGTYEKILAERIIAIKNNTEYEFRTIQLGACN